MHLPINSAGQTTHLKVEFKVFMERIRDKICLTNQIGMENVSHGDTPTCIMSIQKYKTWHGRGMVMWFLYFFKTYNLEKNLDIKKHK